LGDSSIIITRTLLAKKKTRAKTRANKTKQNKTKQNKTKQNTTQQKSEARYGRLLAPYLDDPANLFIISSDFCHWGERFRYTWHERARGAAVWQAVQWLDEAGMAAIEAGDAAAFASYQARYRNTICGRHPIAVLLHMLPHCAARFDIAFNSYDQSSRVVDPLADSSVSYAAALVTVAAGGDGDGDE
jgi:AmmeMemoRadiSam system protein B